VEGSKKMNFKQKFEEAYKIWMFTWMIWHNTKSGKIDYSKIDTNFKVKFDNGEMSVKTTNIPNQSEKIAIHTLIAVTGVCFTALDSAMAEAYGKIDISEKSDFTAMRVIVYQIRNAYAHDPMNPKWVINNPEHRDIFKIEEIGLTIDLNDLNNKEFKVEDVNGLYGIAKLLTYCLNKFEEE
jgi:hypothetical protein